jgi:hypothetical protein
VIPLGCEEQRQGGAPVAVVLPAQQHLDHHLLLPKLSDHY